MNSKPAFRFLCCVVAVFSANSFAQSPAPSIAGANFNAAQSCQRITVTYLADTNISLTEIVSTNTFVAPGADTTMTTPAFCRVVGRASPAVNFEVWLPLSGWNGKYQGVGNGGMAGTISYGSMANALRRGYAVASTDTGHVAGPIPFDASWAAGRPDLIEDFGHRALHITTVNAKQLTEAFYHAAPDYS